MFIVPDSSVNLYFNKHLSVLRTELEMKLMNDLKLPKTPLLGYL